MLIMVLGILLGIWEEVKIFISMGGLIELLIIAFTVAAQSKEELNTYV